MRSTVATAAVALLAGACVGAQSSCLTVKDKESCSMASDDSTSEPCVWCECGAVPSECVSASMSKKLPPSIFKCDAPRGAPSFTSGTGLSAALEARVPSVAAVMQEAPRLFTHWKASQGRSYESREEELARYSVFQDTLRQVATHNLGGASSYTLGLNKFSDRTWEEFKATHLMTVAAGQNCSATHTGASKFAPHGSASAPPAVDWREKGAVSPVKDQKHCGSCWTFSTTGCLESHHFLKTNNMVLLSEQQLVDCAQAFDNHGCNGGLPSHAFEYITSAGGLDTEQGYPYSATDGVCVFDPVAVGATVRASVNITYQDEKELEQAVGSAGPVSVAFDVMRDFKSYAAGVYDNPDCGSRPDEVNHAVLSVGYGTDDNGTPYWIIKNSWGADWGESGYFRMARGQNMCGVADCASYPMI
ncbi:putative cysteine protease family C01A [Tribonema minus]|uniref:Putative cysteine protease family C01A n=1 Tax=Tribonema minus TaxID=303371 RepID=A0A835YKX9_9STRA|nr:putative cysteine protease family C01A [Tribonema minus]